MGYRWIEPIVTAETELIEKYHTVIATVLAARGVQTVEEADRFLNPNYERDCHDPFLFADMNLAIERISKALFANEKVTVYCDYDVDGLSSGAIIYTTLKQLGCNVTAYMNHREHDGYGLQQEALSKLIDTGSQLIITTDCGISNTSEINYVQSRGTDVIITDHHTVPAIIENIPQAVAIIHPLVRAEQYPFKMLAGGGSAFKLAQGLIRTNDPVISDRRVAANDRHGKSVNWDFFEKWLLDLVCLSTIGDCVPLQGENRMLVRYGLHILSKTRRPGLQALLKRLQKRKQTLTSKSISFFLAPRINAASRMDHARIAFDLLIAETEQEGERIADILEHLNTERQKCTEKLVTSARDQLDVYHAEQKKVLVGSGDEWPLGILGLVAGRLCEYYQKPVVLMTNGNGTISGAARSMGEFHLANAFSQLGHLFERHGGHKAAGGFALKQSSSIHEVRQSLEELGEQLITETHDGLKPLPIDAIVSLSDISWELLETIKLFEPHGIGNQKLRFLILNAHIENVLRMGQTQKHVRIDITQTTIRKQCVGFSFADKMNTLGKGSNVDIVCEIDENDWNGTKSIQLSIIDLRAHTL